MSCGVAFQPKRALSVSTTCPQFNWATPFTLGLAEGSQCSARTASIQFVSSDRAALIKKRVLQTALRRRLDGFMQVDATVVERSAHDDTLHTQRFQS